MTVADEDPDPAARDRGPAADGSGPSADRPPHDAEFCFEYPDQRRARLVAEAVGNEVGEIDDDRSRATLSRDGRRLTVAVEAADLVALRAATNTWLGLVDVAERTAEVAEAHR